MNKEELKQKIKAITIHDLINYDYHDMGKNLGIDLDENDLSMVRDDWIDIENQVDIIKEYICEKIIN